MIDISIAVRSNPRRPRFWKLNTFFNAIYYVHQIKSTIQDVKEEYQNDDTMNSALLWEMIKLNVREQSIRYAATKKAKILKREKELEKAINRLQIIIDTERHDTEMENGIAKQEIFKELERKKVELEKNNRVPYKRRNFEVKM